MIETRHPTAHSYNNCFDTDLRAFWLGRMRDLFYWPEFTCEEHRLALRDLQKVSPLTLRDRLLDEGSAQDMEIGLEDYWAIAFGDAGILTRAFWLAGRRPSASIDSWGGALVRGRK